MRIRFLKPYLLFAVGDETDMDAPVATLLCERKVAEELKPSSPEAATVEPGERAVHKRPKRRRKGKRNG